MNMQELEDRIIEADGVTETYTARYGPDAGREVTHEVDLGWVELWCSGTDNRFEVPEVGTLRVVARHRGEGGGDEAWVVIEITDEDDEKAMYRKDGYYASFEGFDFDGRFYEVAPVERPVTFYEAV